jgi:hypothetical protein
MKSYMFVTSAAGCADELLMEESKVDRQESWSMGNCQVSRECLLEFVQIFSRRQNKYVFMENLMSVCVFVYM